MLLIMKQILKVSVVQKTFLVFVLSLFFSATMLGQNPFITTQYRADPTARVFEGKLFLYPSSDTTCEQTKENNGFCMPNYHVYSTTDLTTWKDQGEIMSHNTVPWVKPNSYGMWAPDCNFKNGKYYFYFPAMPIDGSNFRNIGVAIADKPEGPFVPQESYIKGISGIDPNVFVDDDGKAYLFFGGGEKLYGVELNEDMVSVKGKPVVIQNLPGKYKEGPFMFKRKGTYYFTFPHAPEGSEEIAYSVGKSPLGPFEYKGKVLERWKDGCWTNHHSFVEYKDQWYLFYHSMDVSKNQHLRTVCVDKIFFNEDGTIPEIKATKRGVGKMFATNMVQIDRYSTLENAKVERTKNDFVNWSVNDISSNTLLTFNDLEFAKDKYQTVIAYVSAPTKGGEMMLYDGNQKLLATFVLPEIKKGEWKAVSAKLEFSPKGMQNLSMKFKGELNGFKLDWIQFVPKNKIAVVTNYGLEINDNKEAVKNGTNCQIIKTCEFNAENIKSKNPATNLKFEQNGTVLETISKVKKGDLINIYL